jgi:hypothetical protein
MLGQTRKERAGIVEAVLEGAAKVLRSPMAEEEEDNIDQRTTNFLTRSKAALHMLKKSMLKNTSASTDVQTTMGNGGATRIGKNT